jgi:hypothetical protein
MGDVPDLLPTGAEASPARDQRDELTYSGSPTSSAPVLPDSVRAPPFGRERFLLLRKKWLTPSGPPRPVPVDQLDEDSIIEAIAECPGELLEPPVHLPFMAEALAVVWEEEGLYN